MQIKKMWIAFIIILIFSPVLTLSVSSESSSLPMWNKNWSFRQEIKLPISTEKAHAKYKPIESPLSAYTSFQLIPPFVVL